MTEITTPQFTDDDQHKEASAQAFVVDSAPTNAWLNEANKFQNKFKTVDEVLSYFQSAEDVRYWVTARLSDLDLMREAGHPSQEQLDYIKKFQATANTCIQLLEAVPAEDPQHAKAQQLLLPLRQFVETEYKINPQPPLRGESTDNAWLNEANKFQNKFKTVDEVLSYFQSAEDVRYWVTARLSDLDLMREAGHPSQEQLDYIKKFQATANTCIQLLEAVPAEDPQHAKAQQLLLPLRQFVETEYKINPQPPLRGESTEGSDHWNREIAQALHDLEPFGKYTDEKVRLPIQRLRSAVENQPVEPSEQLMNLLNRSEAIADALFITAGMTLEQEAAKLKVEIARLLESDTNWEGLKNDISSLSYDLHDISEWKEFVDEVGPFINKLAQLQEKSK